MTTSSVRATFAALILLAFISCASDNLKNTEIIITDDDLTMTEETEKSDNNSMNTETEPAGCIDSSTGDAHSGAATECPWDISKLDTARNVEYMSSREKDIILEMNMARSNPKLYAELYLEPYKESLTSQKTMKSVNECIETMNLASPAGILKPSEGLSKCAQKHASSQSGRGLTGHNRTDGINFKNDVRKYVNYKILGESVLYGIEPARDIVIQLLIDDGVNGRGHRENLLNPHFEFAGCGFTDNHREYSFECVIDYGGTK